MCGRATYKLTWKEIVQVYRLTLDQPTVNTRVGYNVWPVSKRVNSSRAPDDDPTLIEKVHCIVSQPRNQAFRWPLTQPVSIS